MKNYIKLLILTTFITPKSYSMEQVTFSPENIQIIDNQIKCRQDSTMSLIELKKQIENSITEKRQEDQRRCCIATASVILYCTVCCTIGIVFGMCSKYLFSR